MGSEWKKLSLEDAGVVLIDCVHKTPPGTGGDGVPYIAIPQMNEGRIDFSANPRLITQEHYVEWTKKANPCPNDVVLSRRCNPGETAYVPEGVKFALGQNLVLLRADASIIYPPFLRWLTRGREWWGQISKYLNVGAVFDSLRCADVPRFELTIPSFSEQKAIAHILGTLDDKIQLNCQMNQTLEAMAQALFKSWFVDFDPVIDNALAAGNDIPEPLRARAEARRALTSSSQTKASPPQPDQQNPHSKTPLPPHIRQQFPNAFEFSETMGWIPQGWEVGGYSCIAKLNPESWGQNSFPDEVLYVDLSNTKNGRITSVTTYSFSEAPSRARRVLKPGDTIIGTVRPGNRSFAFISIDGLTGSTGFAAMRPLEDIFRSFIYLGLTQNSVIEKFAHLADGAAYPAIRPDVVAKTETVIPSKELFRLFDSFVYPLLENIAQQESSSMALSKLRDTLLPKLLSGELRIPDAEKQVQDAL